MLAKLILILSDILLINATFLLAFLTRYGINIPEYNFASYKDNFIFLTIVYILSLASSKVFKSRFTSYWDLFKKIFTGLFLGTLFSIALVYVFRTKWYSFPSSVFVISFFIGLLVLSVSNALVLRFFGCIKKKVVVIGKNDITEEPPKGPFIEKTHIDRIEDLLQHDHIDEVVICKKIQEDKQLNLLIYLLTKLNVNVVFGPSIYAELISDSFSEEGSIQFLKTFIGRKSDYEEFMIRALDILGSALILVFFSPFMLLIWALIKLSTGGPTFYKQQRIAKDGKTFTLYKFKTMIDDAEKQTGPVLTAKNDPRVTKIGRFLRTTRLDELPQLLNVIKDDMSLVGPRPERPHFVKRHKTLRQTRLAVKPGLTGLAQIRSFYDLHPKHKTKYDYLYIQKRSFLLNLYILAKTIPVIFSKKGR